MQRHAFLQIGGLFADHIGRHAHLIVGVGVHEVEAVTVLKQVIVVVVLDKGALDLFGGLVTIGGLHAVGNAAHVDLCRRRALAGVEAFGGQHDIELAVLSLENIAFADGAGDDFHEVSFIPEWRGALIRAAAEQKTHLISMI